MQSRPVRLPVLYFGSPVALVSTLNEDGSTNLSPISSYWCLGDTMLIGIGRSGLAYRNLERHPQAVVNLPDASLWTNVEAIAPTTGVVDIDTAKQKAGYRHARDKFALGGFSAVPSERIAPERVRECPLQLEAELKAMHPIGTSDSGLLAVELRVLLVHAHEALVTPDDRVRLERWKPLHYVFRHYFTLGTELGRSFRAG